MGGVIQETIHERQREGTRLPLKEGAPVPWDIWANQVTYTGKLQEQLLRLQAELTQARGETKVLARHFAFESREIHPYETLCAWGQDHVLGYRFHGMSLAGKPGRVLVCHDCWEEIRGHECTSGS